MPTRSSQALAHFNGQPGFTGAAFAREQANANGVRRGGGPLQLGLQKRFALGCKGDQCLFGSQQLAGVMSVLRLPLGRGLFQPWFERGLVCRSRVGAGADVGGAAGVVWAGRGGRGRRKVWALPAQCLNQTVGAGWPGVVTQQRFSKLVGFALVFGGDSCDLNQRISQ